MSGTGANLPVRIEVEGTAQAEQQFNRVGQAGQQAMQRVQQSTQQAGDSTNRFSNIVGQAGFQIGDFASQVQAGGSAMTALSQQGSQFLGAFGTGGAIAGAVLTVGILATQLLTAGDNAEDAAKGVDALEKAMREAAASAADLTNFLARVNARFLSTIEAARVAQMREISGDVRRLEEESNRALLRQAERDADRRRLLAERQSVEGQLANGNDPTVLSGGAMSPSDEAALRRRLTEINGEIASAEGDVRAAQGRVAQLDELRRRSEGLIQGLVQDGAASSNTGPLDDPPEGRGRGRAPAQALDVNAALAATMADLTAQYDAYNAALNLSTAGLERAAPVLQQYAQQQELLTRLVNAGLITEQQFTEEVERSSVALQEQIRAAQERGDSVSGTANQLGFSFSSAFEDAILEGEKLSEVLKALEQDLARIIVRAAITQPLGNAIAGAVSSAVGSYFGTPAPSGGRAAGGPVFGGNTYLVGEQGPELVTFGAAATVTPNHALGGSSITQQFNIDARGADAGLLPRLRAEMAAVVQAGNAALLEQINRGGRAAGIVGRR